MELIFLKEWAGKNKTLCSNPILALSIKKHLKLFEVIENYSGSYMTVFVQIHRTAHLKRMILLYVNCSSKNRI